MDEPYEREFIVRDFRLPLRLISPPGGLIIHSVRRVAQNHVDASVRNILHYFEAVALDYLVQHFPAVTLALRIGKLESHRVFAYVSSSLLTTRIS